MDRVRPEGRDQVSTGSGSPRCTRHCRRTELPGRTAWTPSGHTLTLGASRPETSWKFKFKARCQRSTSWVAMPSKDGGYLAVIECRYIHSLICLFCLQPLLFNLTKSLICRHSRFTYKLYVECILVKKNEFRRYFTKTSISSKLRFMFSPKWNTYFFFGQKPYILYILQAMVLFQSLDWNPLQINPIIQLQESCMIS